jgi:hypothetical protein
MASINDVRPLGHSLERSYEVLVRDRVKFRVGQIVYAAFSQDETIMGFGFPKEERQALVDGDPGRFMLPRQSDMRFHWVHARIGLLEPAEARELFVDAWRLCVPQFLQRAYDEAFPDGPGPR